MGIDACIYCKTSDGEAPRLCDNLPDRTKIITAREWTQESCMHEILQPWRYYGPGYERGPWPLIAAVLMILFASENAETVWYFGDDLDFDGDDPFTSEQVAEFSKHYMKHGNRPYREMFKQ